MHHPTDRIAHTTAGALLEREIAQWVHSMKDRSDDPSHHERTLLPRSYISLPSGEGDKISGVITDKRILFVPHLKYVKKNVLTALIILKLLAIPNGKQTEWTCSVYISLILSKLNCGWFVYESARMSNVQMLDPIHFVLAHLGLHLCRACTLMHTNQAITKTYCT